MRPEYRVSLPPPLVVNLLTPLRQPPTRFLLGRKGKHLMSILASKFGSHSRREHLPDILTSYIGNAIEMRLPDISLSPKKHRRKGQDQADDHEHPSPLPSKADVEEMGCRNKYHERPEGSDQHGDPGETTNAGGPQQSSRCV